MIRLKIGIFCLLSISLILHIASIKEHEAKSDIVVAVIDTKYNQCSFSEGNVWINKNEIAGNDIDDDNNGHIDDCYGWNFSDNKAQCGVTQNKTLHGTTIVHSFWDELADNNQNIEVMLLSCFSVLIIKNIF